jgi:hypothetical protein
LVGAAALGAEESDEIHRGGAAGFVDEIVVDVEAEFVAGEGAELVESEGFVAPFGSNLWRMVKRLKRAAKEATGTVPLKNTPWSGEPEYLA